METPRDVVRLNLSGQDAPRPAFFFDRGRWNDFAGAGRTPSTTFTPRRWEEGGMEYYEDEWGNIWRRMVGGCSKGEIHEPALKDWSQLDELRLPDYDDPARWLTAKTEAWDRYPDYFHLAGFPGWIFADARYLRKMDVYFMDLIEYPEEVHALHTKITDMYERLIRLLGTLNVDAIMFAEDLGVQDRTLISPPMWREFYFDHYRRLTDAAHEGGIKVIQHSCGYNWELLDDLMDAGIDAFQFDQPAIYDQPALAAKLRARGVALFSPLDIQKVLPTGEKETIEAEARFMVENYRNHLMLKNYADLHGIGVREEWDDWAYHAFLEAAGVRPEDAVRPS
jgi:hypothetical protein